MRTTKATPPTSLLPSTIVSELRRFFCDSEADFGWRSGFGPMVNQLVMGAVPQEAGGARSVTTSMSWGDGPTIHVHSHHVRTVDEDEQMAERIDSGAIKHHRRVRRILERVAAEHGQVALSALWLEYGPRQPGVLPDGEMFGPDVVAIVRLTDAVELVRLGMCQTYGPGSAGEAITWRTTYRGPADGEKAWREELRRWCSQVTTEARELRQRAANAYLLARLEVGR